MRDNITSKGHMRPDCDRKDQWLSPFCNVAFSKNSKFMGSDASEFKLFWGFLHFPLELQIYSYFLIKLWMKLKEGRIFCGGFCYLLLALVLFLSSPQHFNILL